MLGKFLATFLILVSAFSVATGQRRRGGVADSFKPFGVYQQHADSYDDRGNPIPKPIIGEFVIVNSRGKLGVKLWMEKVEYRVTVGSATADLFEFTTNEVRGVSYKFSGKFNVKGNLARAYARNRDTAVDNALEGKLTKVRSGKEVGQTLVKLDYLSPGGRDDTERQ